MARRIAPAVGALIVLLMVAPSVRAWPSAPSLVESAPSDEEQLHSAPGEVVLEFSADIDPSASTLEVVNECGKRVDDGTIEVSGSTLGTAVEGDFQGSYSVRYEATGFGSTSGTATGKLGFTVRRGKKCGNVEGATHRHRGAGANSDNGNSNNDNARSGGGTGRGSGYYSSPSTGPTGSSSTAATPTTGQTSRTSSGTSTNGFGGTGGTPALTAPTPTVTPSPFPTATPTPTPTGDAADQELTLASSPQPPSPADGAAAAIALGVVVALGALGGWVLRASAPR